VERRTFIASVVGGLLAAASAFAIGAEVGDGMLRPPRANDLPAPRTTSAFFPRDTPSPIASPQDLPAHFFPPTLAKVPIPGGAITSLPGPGHAIALTVDDGVDTEVVRLYTEFAARTGMRLTFFLNGMRPSWTDNAPALRPLVESGQVQLGNHTWSHPDLTKLSAAGVITELQRNEDFIRTTYGVSAKPYFRPPFGFHNRAVDHAAASIGYTVPVLWYGTLSDSGLITTDQLKSFATQWLLPQHIVIGHANYMPVTECFDFIADLIRSRHLQPVTLDDYFA
jgi:peptidoglycan/xylan/chitin deacetylase (PgdA/CDA1 family)